MEGTLWDLAEASGEGGGSWVVCVNAGYWPEEVGVEQGPGQLHPARGLGVYLSWAGVQASVCTHGRVWARVA